MKHQIALPERFAAILQAWPEDGMGYQIVDVVFKDGRVLERAVVLNGEILEVGERIDPLAIADLRKPRRTKAA